MKIGRNDPCPCGSGKKYKKCCLEKRAVSDLGYKRVSKVQTGLVDKLTEYVARDLGEEFISVAMSEFLDDDLDPSDLWEKILEEFSPIFWPWLFYIFELDALDIEELGLSSQVRPDSTVAEMFIEDKGKDLEKLEHELLASCIRKPFSFFEVEDVQSGQGFRAVNLLSGERHWVKEISASKDLKPGEIIYSLIIEIRGHTTIIGNAQYKFYPRFKIHILRFREELEEDFESVTDDVLLEMDYELRDFFIYLQNALFAPPAMHNSDGDSLSLRTLHYDIASPEQALQSLAPLCVHENEDEIRHYAQLDADKQVRKVQIDWSREGHGMSNGVDDTILGHIYIDGNKMTVEVNSEARENKIKQEIASRLGNQAEFKVSDIKSMDSLMAEAASGPDSGRDKDQETLQNSPEAQEVLKGVMYSHWQQWLDIELPALGGKTPRQAVQTADGREAVQALLRDFEAQEAHSGVPISQQGYIDWARKELGLPDPREDI